LLGNRGEAELDVLEQLCLHPCRQVIESVHSGGFRMTAIIPSALQSRAAGALQWFGRDRLGGQALWIAAPFGVNQVVRLVTSVVLARLLAPEMFGIMLLINTLRTG